MRVRRYRRLRKVLAWGTAVLLASLSGGVWFAYVYVTDSETLARIVRAEAPKYLPGSVVEVAKARVGLFKGEFQLSQVKVWQSLDRVPFAAVQIPWMSVRNNPRAMLRGKFEPTEVIVSQPTLRLRRRKDGTWNLQGLLASPWPAPVMKNPPPLQILNATVELSDGPADAPTKSAILRDVGLRVVDGGRMGLLKFDGTAKGDTFDRLSVLGTVDVTTGRVEFGGDLARLASSETLRARLPAELKPAVARLGITGGEADVRINRVIFDPSAVPNVRYDISGRLRGAVWNCPKLPFPLNDLTTAFAARDGVLTLRRAEGHYGTTTIRLNQGVFSMTGDPETAPLDVDIEIDDLKLDDSLRKQTPPKFAELWEVFRPSGRVSLAVRAVREREGGPLRRKVSVECLDVAMLYKHFQYPIDHVTGTFTWEGERIDVAGLQTLVGGQPLTCRGTVENPGPQAVVTLAFAGKSLPIDKTLLDAMPKDVRKVVNEFNPAGTVSGTATVHRLPPKTPKDDPKGRVAIDAYLDLDERCTMKWVGMPYPVNNLKGRLEIHPDLWIFKNITGSNGQAEVAGSGRVEKVGGTSEKPALKIALQLNATKLPFDDQLRTSLPEAWKKTWTYLSPTGSCDVKAEIKIAPGVPDDNRLELVPRPNTGVTLKYTREPKPGIDAGGTFDLPMEHVTGRFVFNNGPVDMTDVAFRFHDARVQFARGRVVVEDSGKFQLGVQDMWARDLRLDGRLRGIMPPVMAQFAQRLDDGRTFTLKGDMGIGWSGKVGAPVWCKWDRALVAFVDNTVQIQPGLKLENMQGQLDSVRGFTNGEEFELHGALNLASVGLLGQQVTALETPIDVEKGVARLGNIKGRLLNGVLTGKMSVSLDATPKYSASVAVQGADLQQYTKTQPGRQTYRGLVNANLNLSGFGGDLRTIQGGGEAHVVQGELGELPFFLSLLKFLTLSPATKTAFDSADFVLTVRNGKSYFDRIRLVGDAFSLYGQGTMDVQGDLDIALRVVYGRERSRLRLIRAAIGEVSEQFLAVQVHGTPSLPKFDLKPFPEVYGGIKSIGSIGQRRAEQESR